MPGQRLPLQNLPYGRWRRPGEAAWHLGVAIGDQVLDLAEAGLLPHADMNRLMAASLASGAPCARPCSRACAKAARGRRPGPARCTPWRGWNWACPARSATTPTSTPASTTPPRWAASSGPSSRCCPTTAGCPSATTAGPRPSWPAVSRCAARWGRRAARRPEPARFGPSARLDYELELGLFVGRPMRWARRWTSGAESHLFGVTLFNDWSAPAGLGVPAAGPFLAKNFASTVSPGWSRWRRWRPARCSGRTTSPALPYLSDADNQRHGAGHRAGGLAADPGAWAAGHAGSACPPATRPMPSGPRPSC
jgi:fumarylacetoacetase